MQIQENAIITATVAGVYFRKMEHNGVYGSYFVATFKEYPKGIAVVDAIAERNHPDWDKKTDNRASLLANELKGKSLKLKVYDVLDAGKNVFEAVLI